MMHHHLVIIIYVSYIQVCSKILNIERFEIILFSSHFSSTIIVCLLFNFITV